MARRKDYDMMNYDKYRDNKKSFSSGTRNFFRLWGLANISHSQSEAKRKRRRRELDRKIKENEKQLAENRAKHGPITASDIISTIIFLVVAGVLGTVFIDSALNYGLLEAIKITFFGIVIILIIGFIIYYFATSSRKNSEKNNRLTNDEIEELQRQLENIDVYKNIVNTSTDVNAVKYAMDELIVIIDFILQYDEDDLHEAGITKEKLPEQKQFILDNYDVILKQFEEGGEE